MSKIIELAVILLVTIVLSGVTFAVPLAFAKHRGSHHSSSSTASTTNVPANTQSMICTTERTGNETVGTVALTGSLPADVSCPQIRSGLHILYMHFYYDAGWLKLRGAVQTPANYTNFNYNTVLYDNAHQVMNTEPEEYWPLATAAGNIKSFDANIASPTDLRGAATYQINGVFCANC